jgi:hypothetical protein
MFYFGQSLLTNYRSWLFTATLVLVVGILGDSGLALTENCNDAIECLSFFGDVDLHARQYSQIAQSLLKITIAHAKQRELHLRQKRKQASSELFGLLPSEPPSLTTQLDEPRPGSFFARNAAEPSITTSAPLDWTIYDADFFALPWPNEASLSCTNCM